MGADEQAIRALITRWLDATRDGDVETIGSLITDDVIFQMPGQEPMQGKEDFLGLQRVMLHTHHVDPEGEVLEVSVHGDFAYTRTRLEITINGPEGEHHRSGTTLSILRKGADGAWRLSRDANMVA